MILSHTPMPTLKELGGNFNEFQPLNDKGIITIVQNWGNELIKQLQNNLLKNKTNASSSLSESIDPKITQPPGGYNLTVQMLDYYINVEEGQKSGTKVKQKDLIEWIQNKSDIQSRIISKSPDKIAATKSLAYVIQRKIYREGTTAKPFISPALKQVTTATLAKRISTYIVDSLTK